MGAREEEEEQHLPTRLDARIGEFHEETHGKTRMDAHEYQ